MSLEIKVYRLKDKLGKGDKRSDYEVFKIDDAMSDRLKASGLSGFIKRKVNTYYDFKKADITQEKYDCIFASHDKDGKVVFHLIDREHELYDIWVKSGNPEYRPSEEEDTLLRKYGYNPENGIGSENIFDMNDLSMFVTIKGSDIPLFKKNDKVIRGKKVGTMNEGMNELFYRNFRYEDYIVLDRERLQYIYENYCEEDKKETFRSVILDNHVDGETFVVFDV